jgi:hypothetical protein
MEAKPEDAKNAAMLSNVLISGISAVVTRDDFGDVFIDAGKTGKSAYGLKHIIEERFIKDKRGTDFITALVLLLPDVIKTGTVNQSGTDRVTMEKNGIIAVVSKVRNGQSENWLLTGFDDKKNQMEATDAIRTVNAIYGYAPEFSGLRKQVGAIGTSLGISIS